jgi:hypothetical protein
MAISCVKLQICHADFKPQFILPTSIKTCGTILNYYAASYTDLTLKSSSRRVTLTSPWNGGPANRTCQPTQECCWCWCSCYELLLRHEPKTFPSSEKGCLSVPCWTELYNWAWGHSSTSCHLAPTSRLPTGRTALALGTVQGIFTYLI